ncbi:hypothetical protein C0J52_28240 [Blattella germanica]|nr:hypothetical protein C0J52_28240 [Blattella germanica]
MQHKNTIQSICIMQTIDIKSSQERKYHRLNIFNLSEARYRYVTWFIILPRKVLVTVQQNSNIHCLEI